MKRPMKTVQMQRLIVMIIFNIISIRAPITIIHDSFISVLILNNITFRLGPHSVLIMGKQCNGGPEVVMG